jgi:LysR substrate binding domain
MPGYDVHEQISIQANPTHAMRNMLERAAAEQKIRLTTAVETNSMDVQQRLAAAGVGYTVLPSTAVAEDVARGHLTGAPSLDAGLRRRLLIALPGTRRLGQAVRGVAKLLVEEMRRSVESGAGPSGTWLADPFGPLSAQGCLPVEGPRPESQQRWGGPARRRSRMESLSPKEWSDSSHQVAPAACHRPTCPLSAGEVVVPLATYS